MDKQIVVTAREQQILISALRKQRTEEARLLNSDDPVMVRFARRNLEEIDALVATITNAELA